MLLSDLLPLEDILDTIECDEFSEEDELELYNSILQLIDEYMADNPTEITEPDFEETLLEELYDLLESTIDQTVFYELEEMIEYAIEQYFSTISPPRSYPDTFIQYEPNISQIQARIDYLKTKPQPVQRTAEWYQFRRNLITASNAYKAFESQSSQNQLIYEKCKKEEEPILPSDMPKQINTSTTLHWGQKYEPVSVALYEYMYDTKVGDFGCIQHERYPFLGASPDGINVMPESPRFGRMLEIKNIVNREIDGIPKKEYWIQMQLQMETCDLDECDFLETQFKEYETYNDFITDTLTEYKGIVMQYTTEEGALKYIYSPIGLSTDELEEWQTVILFSNPWEWICNHYWKIEKMSCVLVDRNRHWFESNIDKLSELWDTVLLERQTGFEHRAPNKKQIVVLEKHECLFVMNENGKILS